MIEVALTELVIDLRCDLVQYKFHTRISDYWWVTPDSIHNVRKGKIFVRSGETDTSTSS